MLGHKDHGKSTFLGRLLFETHSIPSDRVQTVREIDHEAGRTFEWAHLMDSFREEREEEMTWGGAAMFVEGKKRGYRFFDVPGHEELVWHMLSGASRAHAAVLIVSAKEGIDVMSVKHMLLAKFLGVRDLVVAVNKMDAVGWNENIFNSVKDKVDAEIKKSDFETSSVRYVPISAFNGDNVVSASKKAAWYKGLSVFEIVESFTFKDPEGIPMRFLVQDVMVHDGKIVAVGNVKNGTLAHGASLVSLPSETALPPFELMDSAGNAVKKAEMEENPAIVFRGSVSIAPREIFASADNRPVFLTSVPSRIFLFHEIKGGEPVTLECGTMRSEIKNRLGAPTMEIAPATFALASRVLFDTSPTFLNLFVLKQKGEIVGVGRVVSIGVRNQHTP